MGVKEELAELLRPTGASTCVVTLENNIQGVFYRFDLNASYEPPEVDFKLLVKLSQLFGTEEIDLDDYCNGNGCDTCGYGSSYGRTIEIYKPSKNWDLLEELVLTKEDILC